MRWLLDTSVLIDHLRGDARAVRLLTDAAERSVELWSVTPVRTEVLAGMRPSEASATHSLLGALQWVEVTIELTDRAGELARAYLRSHRGVDTIDYLIAAAAQGLEAELKTTNTKHFPMFTDLRAAYR